VFFGGTGDNTADITNGAQWAVNNDLGAEPSDVNVWADEGSVTFNVSQHLKSLLIRSSGLAKMSQNGGHVLITRNLSINPEGGRLDLTDNDLVVDYNSVSALGTWNGFGYDGITGLIARGYDGGVWDGAGIVTSMTAAISPNSLTTLGVAEASDSLGISGSQTALVDGQTVDATAVLVKYTYAGDANLDGAITGDDYFQIDSAFPQALHGYLNGDFNYDGVINGDDYFLIDSNFSAQGLPL
jgi:hypothetical protein